MAFGGVFPLWLFASEEGGTSSASFWPRSMLTERLKTEFAVCLPRAGPALSRTFEDIVLGLVLRYALASLPQTAQ